MTDSGGRSASLSRDHTIPAGQHAAQVRFTMVQMSICSIRTQLPSEATLAPSALTAETAAHVKYDMSCYSLEVSLFKVLVLRHSLRALHTRSGQSVLCCYCVLRAHRALSNWRRNDELILFPTTDLDWMMSSSANLRLA